VAVEPATHASAGSVACSETSLGGMSLLGGGETIELVRFAFDAQS
jgi:hypothetical protein